jgi:hypothetical protein
MHMALTTLPCATALANNSHCEECAKAATESRKDTVIFCVDCRQKFCEDCIHIHGNIRAACEHKLVEMGDEEVSRGATAYCDKRCDEALKLFCFDCEATICFMCFV